MYASIFVKFNINLYVLFIYEDICTKFADNVHGYENISIKTFGLISKKKMAVIVDCSKT